MKKTLIAVAALFLLITTVVILGNVITIGEKMTKVFGTPYLEYAFYLLLLVVLLWLVAYPMYRIHSAPEFPILDVDANGGAVPLPADGVAETAVPKDYQKRLYALPTASATTATICLNAIALCINRS